MNKVLMWILSMIFLISNNFISYASSTQGTQYKVVFLVDLSSSMKENEKAVSSLISVALYTLPKDVDTGYVSYSDGIISIRGFDASRKEISEALSSDKSGGYSNSGAGFSEAVRLMSEGEGKGRIVWFSDGETDMKSQGEIDHSRSVYDEAVEIAKNRGIEVDMYSFASDSSDEYIYSSTRETSGELAFCSQSGRGDLVKSLLFNTLSVEFGTLEAGESSEEGLLHIERNHAYMDNTELLIFSEAELGSITPETIEAEVLHCGDCALISVIHPPEKYSFHVEGSVSEVYTLDQYDLSLDIDVAESENTNEDRFVIEAELFNDREENVLSVDTPVEASRFYINGKEYVPDIREDRLYVNVDRAGLRDARSDDRGKLEIEYRILDGGGSCYHIDNPLQTVYVLEHREDQSAAEEISAAKNDAGGRKSLIPLYTALGLLLMAGTGLTAAAAAGKGKRKDSGGEICEAPSIKEGKEPVPALRIYTIRADERMAEKEEYMPVSVALPAGAVDLWEMFKACDRNKNKNKRFESEAGKIRILAEGNKLKIVNLGEAGLSTEHADIGRQRECEITKNQNFSVRFCDGEYEYDFHYLYEDKINH